MTNFSKSFIDETVQILRLIDFDIIEELADEINAVREKNGRLFICGVGGSAGHASHAVNDFRKLANIESYSPTDNVSEVTARTNDEGWETVFEEFLRVSKVSDKDALLIFSVGGGSKNPAVSTGLIKAIDFANKNSARVLGIVGRDGGYTKANGNCVLVIPNIIQNMTTPQTEGITALIWHLIVSHPKVKARPTKW
jgi:D-sedoheptulose 7-phosphate isomerase